MPPLSILNNRAFLVSPLDMPVYLLELSPDPKGPQGSLRQEALLEKEIRNRLKTLYPGAPEDTEIDYTLCPGDKKNAPLTAVVYASSRSTGALYRGLRRPLVPGTAVMRLALGRAGLGSALCVIAAEAWVEAALFEGARILRCGSCPAPAPASGGLPFSFVTSFGRGGESGAMAAILIRAGVSGERGEQTEQALLRFFGRVVSFDIDEVVPKRTMKSLGIFNDSRRRTLERHRRSTGALLLLSCVSLLVSLQSLSGRIKLELARLEQQEREQRQALDRAKALEREIAELPARGPTDDPGRGSDPYALIAGLQRCLSGGWIKSLIIQGDRFDLEAEGTDSLAALRSLRESGAFSDLSLRRASPSPLAGDQFLISGKAGTHGNN
jgi:hypothetical protein